MLNPKFHNRKNFEQFKSRYNSIIKTYCTYVSKIKSSEEQLIVLLNKYNADILKLIKLKNVKAFNLSDSKITSKRKYSTDDIEIFSNYTDDLKSLREKLNIYNGKFKSQISSKIDVLEQSLRVALKDMEYERFSRNV